MHTQAAFYNVFLRGIKTDNYEEVDREGIQVGFGIVTDFEA